MRIYQIQPYYYYNSSTKLRSELGIPIYISYSVEPSTYRISLTRYNKIKDEGTYKYTSTLLKEPNCVPCYIYTESLNSNNKYPPDPLNPPYWDQKKRNYFYLDNFKKLYRPRKLT